MAKYGMLAVLSNDELDARHAEMRGVEAAPVDSYAHLNDRLSSHIESVWQANRQAKEPVQNRILANLRQRQGAYTDAKLLEIKEQGGSELYMMLTNVKCRAAESWIRDVVLPESGDRPFAIDPTPIPDIPADVMAEIEQIVMEELQVAMQAGDYPRPEDRRRRINEVKGVIKARVKEQARMACELMTDEVDDSLTEGHWYDVLDECISDFVTLPACIMKGPVVRKGKKLRWEKIGGKFKPIVDDELMPYYYRVSPIDLYPAPDSRGINDGGLIEHVRLRRDSLYAMIGVATYHDDRIRAALSEYADGYTLSDINESAQRKAIGQSDWWSAMEKPISALEYYGTVPGTMLLEWGMPAKKVPDPLAEYSIIALKVGRFVVRCSINEDPLGKRPYDKESFDRVNDQFWGKGVPDLMTDLQDICNAAARSIVNNMALASGPMVEVETDRLAAGEDVTQLYPWRIFQTKAAKSQTPSPAIRFHQPDIVVAALQSVYDYFSRLADDYTGIPAYATGSPAPGGAGQTSSGLSMLMGNALRGIKRAVARIDTLIKGSVDRTHVYRLMYVPGTRLHGDVVISARGASSLVAREQQQVRKTEFLQATANDIDMQIMGPEGRARILRDVVANFGIPVDEVIPDKDTVIRRAREAMEQELAMQQAQDPAAAGAAEGASKSAPQTLDAAGNPAGGLNLMSGAN